MIKNVPLVLGLLFSTSAIASLVTVGPAAARKTGRIVTVAAKPSLPHGANAAVILRAHTNPRNLVLIDPDKATSSDLASAFRLLTALRTKFGDSLSRDIEAVPKHQVAGTHTNAIVAARMQRYLHAIGSSKPISVPGFGELRAINVGLAPPRR